MSKSKPNRLEIDATNELLHLIMRQGKKKKCDETRICDIERRVDEIEVKIDNMILTEFIMDDFKEE